MGCVIEFSNPVIRFNFMQNKLKQKTLIDALLRYSHLQIPRIASIIEVPFEKLNNVHNGLDFLEKEFAENLGELFLLMFSD